MSEFSLIQRFFAEQAALPGSRGGAEQESGLRVGIGDDCAVFDLAAGEELVTTTDTLVGGVHFPEGAEAELIGQRALRVNLSDVAAMGAQARWFLLSLTLPDEDENWLEGFSDGLFSAARQYGCSLVGGNTTRGPLSISITAFGTVPKGKALLRSSAWAGDEIYVTGSLGDAAAALGVIGLPDTWGAIPSSQKEATASLIKRYWLPSPRLAEGLFLRDLASAAIDISDGLLADLGHIAKASDLGAELCLAALPQSPALRAAVSNDAERNVLALVGGDDYELCFTVHPDKVSVLDGEIAEGRLVASRVGRMVAGGDIRCYDKNGQEVSFDKSGYQHF